METQDQQYSDIELICNRCQRSFLWTGGEQGFYEERGLAQPKYCKPCRVQRKAEFQAKTPRNENR